MIIQMNQIINQEHELKLLNENHILAIYKMQRLFLKEKKKKKLNCYGQGIIQNTLSDYSGCMFPYCV